MGDDYIDEYGRDISGQVITYYKALAANSAYLSVCEGSLTNLSPLHREMASVHKALHAQSEYRDDPERFTTKVGPQLFSVLAKRIAPFLRTIATAEDLRNGR